MLKDELLGIVGAGCPSSCRTNIILFSCLYRKAIELPVEMATPLLLNFLSSFLEPIKLSGTDADARQFESVPLPLSRHMPTYKCVFIN